jgi:ribosomal protein S12 methylthiotransferase
MALQKKIGSRKQRARIGETVELLVDGPSPEHDLVIQARLRGQAPDIDPVVFLTESDPDLHRPGDIIRAEIVNAREYDFVARPLVAEIA